MSSVDAFKRSVNAMTETESEATTTSARRERMRAPVSDAPTIMGSNGKMHGASTVAIPASTDTPKKIMLDNFKHNAGQGWASAPLLKK